jgi:hypothetical protein
MCSHEGEVVILMGFKSGSEYVWRAPLSAQTGPKGAVGMSRPECQNRLCGRDCPDGVWALETEVSARDEFHRRSERWVSPGRGLARVFREMGAAVLCGASRGGAVGGGSRLFPTDLAVDEALHDAHIHKGMSTIVQVEQSSIYGCTAATFLNERIRFALLQRLEHRRFGERTPMQGDDQVTQ